MKHSTSYAPDDAGIGVRSLEFLHGHAGGSLREAARAILEGGMEGDKGAWVAQIARLRKVYPAEHVHAALTLAQLQARGAGPRGKFPMLSYLWGTPEALEQATHGTVARYKARRFAASKPNCIVDLCAGIGGDTMGLAEVAPVTAVDRSAVRTACLGYNLDQVGESERAGTPAAGGGRFPVTVVTHEIEKVLGTLPRAALFHIDPARRSGGKRSAKYEELIPGPAVLDAVMTHFSGGAIKLSSAVDFDSLPAGHLELISHRRVVVQAVLWVGAMAELFPGGRGGTRTASVLLDGGADFSMTVAPGVAEMAAELPVIEPSQSGRMLFYELDGALTRAGLAGPFAVKQGLTPVTSDGGYAMARPGASVIAHAALLAFEVLALLPYSVKRVAEVLHALPQGEPGAVEVKTRGRLPGIDVDQLQVAWTHVAPFRRTVLLFLHGGEVMAAIANR